MIGCPIPANINKDTLEKIVSTSYVASDWAFDAWAIAGYKSVYSTLTSQQMQTIADSDWILVTLTTNAPTGVGTAYLASENIIPVKSLAHEYSAEGYSGMYMYLPIGVASNSTTSSSNKIAKTGYVQFNIFANSSPSNTGGWYISMPDELIPANLTITIYRINS